MIKLTGGSSCPKNRGHRRKKLKKEALYPEDYKKMEFD